VKLEPELLQFLGKQMNLWHICIPMIENEMKLFPKNERHVHALAELYNKLVEEDYVAGLRRSVTRNPETLSLISYVQHHKWEEVNLFFGNYIEFFSDQFGLFKNYEQMRGQEGKLSLKDSKDGHFLRFEPDQRHPDLRPSELDLRVWEESFT